MMVKKRSLFAFFLLVAAIIAVADQLIKMAVVSGIELYEQVDFIPKILSLTHIKNEGAAWSIMAGKTWFLIGMPVVISVVVILYMYKNRCGSRLLLTSLSMVLGGGIANLIDRIRLGWVVDYLKLELFDFPIFNFADICIVVGAILFAVCTLFIEEYNKSDSKPEVSKKEDGESDAGKAADA